MRPSLPQPALAWGCHEAVLGHIPACTWLDRCSPQIHIPKCVWVSQTPGHTDTPPSPTVCTCAQTCPYTSAVRVRSQGT